jgi:septum formation protein
MQKLLDGKHVILASNSPRRRELLAGLDLDFEVKVLPDID